MLCLIDPAQLEGGEFKSEGQKDTEGTERTTSSSSAIKSTNDSALSSNSTIVVPVGLSLGANCMLVSASFLKCTTNLHGCTGIDSHIFSLDILDFCVSVLIISYKSFVNMLWHLRKICSNLDSSLHSSVPTYQNSGRNFFQVGDDVTT
ncbi:hypothetical protein Hanom_Chr10g00884461 [Helianthus anomalus]